MNSVSSFKLQEIAAAHGFQSAAISETAIIVFMPWTRNAGQEFGIDVVEVCNHAALMVLLGY